MVIDRAGTSRAEIDRAYAWCARIAREHYENFPVASWLLPKRMRPAISAIYAFARRADDFADEPGPTDAERLRLLDDWVSRLRRISSSEQARAFASLRMMIWSSWRSRMRSNVIACRCRCSRIC